ncbi:MAG TPA: hypothetical protein VFR86_06945 [Burkholderiaceae bacterium]|nr:hypothetical protein [Burkholderiaceae bacterium]
MTTALSIATNNGQLVVPSIINQAPLRIPIGGKVRPGIKVLTRHAEQNAKARAVYEQGLTEGKSFDYIEEQIKAAAPDLKNPLVPKNTPYFTARRGDFANEKLADRILDLYGEDKGDGVRRLYRFPVVFVSDHWEHVMPHALKCFGSSGLKYWSEYSPDGQERYCMTYEAVPVDSEGRRAIRVFGGRQHVRREENAGRCDPLVCREYQSKQCNLSGRFIFFIPGVSSLNPIEMPTNSFVAMSEANAVLENVRRMRGGRISGFLHGQQTFWFTKVLKEVPHIDEFGKPVRVRHFIITLEAEIDPSRLLRGRDDEEVRLAEGARAAEVLGAGEPGEGAASSTKERVIASALLTARLRTKARPQSRMPPWGAPMCQRRCRREPTRRRVRRAWWIRRRAPRAGRWPTSTRCCRRSEFHRTDSMRTWRRSTRETVGRTTWARCAGPSRRWKRTAAT